MNDTVTTPQLQAFHDVFVTAVEGGVSYWATVTGYHWSTGDAETEDLIDFGCTMWDEEDDGHEYPVDREVIRRGWRLAATEWAERLNWSTAPPPYIVNDHNYDGIDLDAGDADMIVQLGLFGEVKYG